MGKTNKINRIELIVSTVILSFYLWILFSLHTFEAETISLNAVSLAGFGILAVVISLVILFVFGKLELPTASKPQRIFPYTWLLISAVTFLVFLIYWAGQYPGGMSPDTIEQYAQAVGLAPYSNWHPFLHTLLFFTLPLKTGLGFPLIVFLQLLYFSIAMGYLCRVMYKNGCPKLVLMAFYLYIVLNPFLATYLVVPWKDIACTIFAIVLMGYAIQIYASKGKWLENHRNLILTCLVTFLCTIMRHNAILFTAPLFLTELFYMVKNRKVRVITIAGVIACYVLLSLSLNVLDIKGATHRTLETVGLPVTIWCNVMQETPEALPEDTRDALYQLASREAYEENYTTGNFNDFKWSGTIDLEKIDQMSYPTVLEYTIQCFRYAPKESLKALVKLTDMVWGLTGSDMPLTPMVCANQWGIQESHFELPEKIVEALRSFADVWFINVLFGSYGAMMLTMLALASLLFTKNRAAFIHILPLFCYNFGTMLLLSGRDYRFFLLNIPLWIPVLFLMWIDTTELKKRKGEN